MFKSIYSFFHRHYHRHYHGVYKNPKKLFIFDLFLLFIAAVMLASSLFFFVWKPGTTDLIDLKISLGDTRIKSGEMVEVSVSYTNRTKFELINPTLALHLPDGFIVDRTKTPENSFSKDSLLTLPAIKPGSKGQAVVYGTLWAAPKTDERILASLSYTTGQSSEPEQKLASYFITLPGSILEDTLSIATTTFPRSSIPFVYTLTNTADYAISNLGITDTWSEPLIKTYTGKDLTLPAHGSITVTGTLFTSSKSGDYSLTIGSHVVPNNISIDQTRQERTIKVVSPDLHSEIKSNKSFSYLEPNQEVPLTISWKNNSTIALDRLILSITPTPGIIDLAKSATENHLKLQGGSLVIDSSRRTALTHALPGNGDSIDITLYTLPSFKNNSASTKLTIIPSMSGVTPLVLDGEFNQEGTSISFALPTDLTLQTQVRYFTAEGDQLGRGPLPPEVGTATKYWVFVELFNTINPVDNARLTITLSPGVTYGGKQSVTLGPPLTSSGNSLTWQFPEIPASTKTGWYFEVTVTPTESSVGKNLSLIQNISLSTTDAVVNKEFTLSSGALNNVLKTNDRGARSGSRVVQP